MSRKRTDLKPRNPNSLANLTKGHGRPKGVPNKANREVKLAAQKYTVECLQTLGTIMREGKNETARIAAANALLDRGHGKPPQALTDGEGGPLIPALVEHVHVTE